MVFLNYQEKGWLALQSQPFPHLVANGATQADERKRRSLKKLSGDKPWHPLFFGISYL